MAEPDPLWILSGTFADDFIMLRALFSVSTPWLLWHLEETGDYQLAKAHEVAYTHEFAWVLLEVRNEATQLQAFMLDWLAPLQNLPQRGNASQSGCARKRQASEAST